MKKYLMLLVVLAATLFSINGFAFNAPPPPAHGGYVLDQTGRMSVRDIQDLNRKIDQISKATKNEFGVLLMQDMGGDNIEDAAQATWKSWGIGKRGLDNGILILVALKEHKSRIQTGKGVEGEITDLQTQDILKQHLNPHLKRGDFYGGFNETLDTLSGLLESRANQKVKPAPLPLPQSVPASNMASTATVNTSPDSSGLSIFFIFGILAFVLCGGIMLAFYLAEQSSKDKEEQERREEEELRYMRENSYSDRNYSTPYVAPAIPAPVYPRYTPPEPVYVPSNYDVAATSAASIALAAEVAAEERRERTEAKRQREEDRRQREEDRRQRESDAEERCSNESSSSLFDLGSSSSDDSSSSSDDSSGSDDSGGFGGGDSGGGGSDSSW